MGVCMSLDDQTLQIASASSNQSRGKKKIIVEMLDSEVKVASILNQMPTRLCANGCTFSACAFTKQGCKGINQDCIIVWEEFAAARSETVFCGIFDGHGPYGHLVARKVRDTLPCLLALPPNLRPNGIDSLQDDENAVFDQVHLSADTDLELQSEHTTSTGQIDSKFLTCDGSPAINKTPANQWAQKFVAAYKLMDMDLKSYKKICCYESGTTAVTMIVQGKDLVIGNVGDSRAVLGQKARENGSWTALQLTTDLKPNLPKELERIKRCKGRVFALEDEPNVARVWLPHLDMPGLAMARALGDFCLKEYGLSAIPQTFYRRLTDEDEFVVLASDGIWDVLSNEDVVRIVASAQPKEMAAKALVHAAVRAWKLKHGVWRTDDCSAVCYFIKQKLVPTFSIRADQ